MYSTWIFIWATNGDNKHTAFEDKEPYYIIAYPKNNDLSTEHNSLGRNNNETYLKLKSSPYLIKAVESNIPPFNNFTYNSSFDYLDITINANEEVKIDFKFNASTPSSTNVYSSTAFKIYLIYKTKTTVLNGIYLLTSYRFTSISEDDAPKLIVK